MCRDRPLPAPALAEVWRDAEAALAENTPLLAYLKHCGSLVSDVLTGRESPLETLFPGGYIPARRRSISALGNDAIYQ